MGYEGEKEEAGEDEEEEPNSLPKEEEPAEKEKQICIIYRWQSDSNPKGKENNKDWFSNSTQPESIHLPWLWESRLVDLAHWPSIQLYLLLIAR